MDIDGATLLTSSILAGAALRIKGSVQFRRIATVTVQFSFSFDRASNSWISRRGTSTGGQQQAEPRECRCKPRHAARWHPQMTCVASQWNSAATSFVPVGC
jgi:hypothetical protein